MMIVMAENHVPSFNPVLGFLSVSTREVIQRYNSQAVFQSRAGFSECLDRTLSLRTPNESASFNPVLGFLSVSTSVSLAWFVAVWLFQSRAGFSECLDIDVVREKIKGFAVSIPCWVF